MHPEKRLEQKWRSSFLDLGQRCVKPTTKPAPAGTLSFVPSSLPCATKSIPSPHATEQTLELNQQKKARPCRISSSAKPIEMLGKTSCESCPSSKRNRRRSRRGGTEDRIRRARQVSAKHWRATTATSCCRARYRSLWKILGPTFQNFSRPSVLGTARPSTLQAKALEASQETVLWEVARSCLEEGLVAGGGFTTRRCEP